MEPKIQYPILIDRRWFTDKATIGELYFDGKKVCYTLEDTCRNVKVDGETAIPSGEYEVVIDHSDRFGKDLPHILDVPYFSGVRIHKGNAPSDTLGCILVGMRKEEDAIYDCQKAFDLVIEELNRRLEKGKVFINIVGGTSKEKFKA